MKKLFIILLVMTVHSSFSQGVNFEDITLGQALEKAGVENKLVFLDGYTSWCGPCKWMASEQFTKPEAGEFFNKHFVNIKIDVEKGEGVEIAERYNIKAYPTFVILEPDGSLRHTVVGGDTLHLFIPRVELALEKETSLSYLLEKQENGTLTTDEAIITLNAMMDAYLKDEAQQLADKLFETTPDAELTGKKFWPVFGIIGYTGLDSPRFRFLLENQSAFTGQNDPGEVNRIISKMFTDHLMNHTTGRITKDGNLWMPDLPEELPLIRQLINISVLPDKDFYLAWTDLAEAMFDKRREEYQALLDRVMEFPQSREGYNERHFGTFVDRHINPTED